MKHLLRLLTLLLLVVAAQTARAATITITVGDNYFSPQTVTVRAGDVVKWQYQSGSVNTHPVASDNGAWTTFTINSANVSQSLTMTRVGSFPYHCDFHGSPGAGMYGVITVTAALPTTPAQATEAVLQVYPNPAREAVTLKLAAGQARGEIAAQLLDQLGRVVRTRPLGPVLADKEVTLSVADLPAGLYICRLLVDGELVATQQLTLVQ